MSTALLIAPVHLQHARRQLTEMRCDDKREVSRLMTLAECNFRLAVHPETDTSQAVELLHEAVKFDGSNPKYAYHLGRICFLRGKFKEAARWFRLACCLVPTSHRIWAHVAILLRELNAAYHGDERFEPNVLLNRAKAITKAIREGDDNIDPDLLDFVPPKSRAAKEKEAREGSQTHSFSQERETPADVMRPSKKVRRYLNARKCRWSGVDHLFVEQAFEGRATQSNVGKLAPVLQELAEKTGARRGHAAAIVILCIQWLLSGYPVASVRRIMASLSDGTPSWHLLDRVCRIFEAPLQDVARLVATAIERGQLPPLVGALVHRQRLLWHPLEFRKLDTYRAARQMISEARHENGAPSTEADEEDTADAARELTRRLERAVKSLAATPPKPFKDEVAKGTQTNAKSGPALVAHFTALEDGAKQLERIKDEAFRLVKDGVDAAARDISTAEMYGQVVADRQAAGEFVELLATTIENCLQELHQLSETLPGVSDVQLPDDFASRSEDCVSTLQSISNLGKFAKTFKRIDKRIAAAGENFVDSPGDPAAEWSTIQAALKSALPDSSAVMEDGGEASSGDAIEDWLIESERFQKQFDEDWSFVKDCAARHKSDCLDDEPLAKLTEVRARFDSALETADRRVAQISEMRLSANVVPEDVDRLTTAENQYLQVLKMRGKFLKRFAKLPDTKPSQSQRNAPAPTDDTGSADAPAAPIAEPPAAPKPREEMDPVEQLEYALICTDWSVGQMFATAMTTFDPFPEWIRLLPPFESLRRKILGQKAEITYRLGRRQAARMIWNGMLRTHRLDIDALKNIAICDTINGDIGRVMNSWQEYVELLYAFDVLLETPRPHAAARVQFHRAFGNAYAPAFLSAKFDHEWKDQVDAASLISFLSSAGRFREFLKHRLLEYLSTRFEFESPSLVLGLKRVEAESHVDDAEKTMTEFVTDVGAMIPNRVRPSFTRLAQDAIRRAAQECRNNTRLTLQATPTYPEEEKRQIELLVRMFDLKIKLVIAFRENLDMVKNITSFEFLHELSTLDKIPLELSPGLFPIVANTMGVEPEMLADLTSSLRQNVILALLEYLLADDDDDAERPIRQRQYQLLTGEWLQTEEFQEFAQLIDTPLLPQILPEEAAVALSEDREEVALKYVRQWHDHYPAMAGLAAWIANKLIKRKELDEARSRLERSLELVFFESTRRTIRVLLVQILIREVEPLLEDENYEQALDPCIEMVRLDDFQPAIVTRTLDLFAAVAMQTKRRQREADVKSAVNDWLARASALALQPETDEEEFPRPSQTDIDKVKEAFKQAMSKVANV